MAMTNCRHFNGYRPCKKSETCSATCGHLSVPTKRILVIHLEAMGSVLRSTSILPAIHRKYPGCHVTWVTKKPSDQLFANNPLVERVLTTTPDDLLALHALHFDIAYVLDKSLVASGILRTTKVKEIYGFVADTQTGAIVPATPQAGEMWQLGLSDDFKFNRNKKTEGQLWIEALDLSQFKRDAYVLQMTEEEEAQSAVRRSEWIGKKKILVGINTGCSPWIAYRQLTVAKHRELIAELQKNPEIGVVLLGGPEETAKNKEIGKGLSVIESETAKGPRDGMISMQACDIVISGDSFGMHMAIGLKKWVVAWFGPTVSTEVDLFDRGVQVLSKAACGPCYKRKCNHPVMCYDQVAISELIDGVNQGIIWTSSSSKPHSSEIRSSVSHSSKIFDSNMPTEI